MLGLASLILISSIVGVAYGYGKGYEDAMLEGMTEKQKNKYWKNKIIQESFNKKYD